MRSDPISITTSLSTSRPRTIAGLVGVFVGIYAMFFASPAWSAGLGANFTFGYSDGEVEDDGDFFPDIETSADIFEGGFSFDTNLAQDRLVNYRLSMNVQIVEQKLNQGSDKVKIDGAGFSFNQVIGFGLVRTPHVRVFIGPSLHLGYAYFDDHETVQGVRVEYEEGLFTAGLGPELGLNYHMGRHVTVSLSAYYRFGAQSMYFDSPFRTSGSSDRYFDGWEHRVGLTTAVFYRFGRDQYKKRPRRVRKKPVAKPTTAE